MGTVNVGLDCQVALDGVGYWIEPRGYRARRPRLRKATVTAGGGEVYVDAGPGKRVWTFTVLALNGLTRYDGRPAGLSGSDYRDALAATYAKIGPLPFVDPRGGAWNVHVDDLVETLPDGRVGLDAPAYLLRVELVEA